MTAGNDLTCKEMVEIITEYLEGTMPRVEVIRFEAHLQKCGGCRTYLEQMRQTVRALGKIPDTELSPDAQEWLLKTFRGWWRSGVN